LHPLEKRRLITAHARSSHAAKSMRASFDGASDPKRTSQKLRDFGADAVRQTSLTLRERERGIVSSTLDAGEVIQ
jgi:hypothetical protein